MSKTSKNSLKAGTYKATVTSLNREPANENPTHITIGVKLEGHEEEAFQKFKNTLKKATFLKNAVKAILNRPLTAAECKSGEVLTALVGKPCLVTVTKKSGKSVQLAFTPSKTLDPNAPAKTPASSSPKHADKGSSGASVTGALTTKDGQENPMPATPTQA